VQWTELATAAPSSRPRSSAPAPRTVWPRNSPTRPQAPVLLSL